MNVEQEILYEEGSATDLPQEVPKTWTQQLYDDMLSVPVSYLKDAVMRQMYDSEEIREVAFHPRPAAKGSSTLKRRMGVIDGEYPIMAVDGSGIECTIGYRLYPFRRRSAPRPLVVYFHGNGENAADMDHMIGLYRSVGCSVLSVDFRGYGWSTGLPSLVTLTSDAAELMTHLPNILQGAGLEGAPCILMGRSLGSACAIELAFRFERQFVGLVLESAVFSLLELPVVAELLGEWAVASLPDPFLNGSKLTQLRQLRVLVVHGGSDELVPQTQAEALYAACGVGTRSGMGIKELCVLSECGHDDLSLDPRYEETVSAFLSTFLVDVLVVGRSVLPRTAETPTAAPRPDGVRPAWARCLGCFSHELAEVGGRPRASQ